MRVILNENVKVSYAGRIHWLILNSFFVIVVVHEKLLFKTNAKFSHAFYNKKTIIKKYKNNNISLIKKKYAKKIVLCSCAVLNKMQFLMQQKQKIKIEKKENKQQKSCFKPVFKSQSFQFKLKQKLSLIVVVVL